MKVFSISNRKGGVGKSTFTRMVATLLFHMSFGKRNICIVDFDEQATTSGHRIDELKENLKKKAIKDLFPDDYKERIQGLYPIYSWSYDKYLKNLPTLKKNFDCVFLDFPGILDIKQKQVLQSIDKVLIPVLADPDDMKSSMAYMKVCKVFKIKPAWFLNLFKKTKFMRYIRDDGHERFFERIDPNLEKLKYPSDHENSELAGSLVVINDRPEVIRVAKSTIVPYDDIEKNIRAMVKWFLS